METISNIATAAANAVWGSDNTTATETTSTTKEPLSGVTGDTSKGEPYDAGNISTPVIDKQEPLSGVTANTTKGEPCDVRNFTLAPSSTDLTTGTPLRQAVSPAEPNDHDYSPSKIANLQPKEDDRSKLTQFVLQENRDNTRAQTAEPQAKQIGETGEGTPASQDPTLEQQPAKGASSDQNPQESRNAASQGTGEQYVQSTGLRADGGDFNATKPGAGQEAERLLEEKHVREGGPDDSGNDESGKAGALSGKKGLVERIKAKFHKH